MKLTTSIVVLLAGGFASVVAIVACFLLPFNILFFMWNYIIPLGAVAAGFVGGLGYYIAAKKVNHRPGYMLLAGMLGVTAVSWCLGFFLIYALSKAASSLSFINWMDEYFTSVTYRKAGHDGGKLGKFGYGLAAIQLLGYLVPIYVYFMVLRANAYCEACGKFYKNLGSLSKRFRNIEGLTTYLAKLHSKQIFSYEYCDVLAESPETLTMKDCTAALNYQLRQCPGCKREILSSSGMVLRGKQWAPVKELGKTIQVTQGSTLLSAFGKQVT
ncbi:MAG: hypothetical protein ACAH83_09415 [Alphaproteobacteria bacterium]